MTILSALWLARVPATAFMVVGFFWGAFAASVPQIKDQIGVGDAHFGFLLLGNAFGLVTAMWAAPMFDRWLGARGMQVSAVFFSLCFILPGLATAPWVLFCALLVMGMTSGMLDVLMNARVSELEARHKRTLMNVSHGMFSVAYAISAFMTGLSRDAGNGPWVALGVAAVASLMLSVFMKIAPDAGEDDTTIDEGFPWMIVLLCGGIVLVAFLTEGTVETWSALHIERTLGGDALAGAIGPTMLGLTMAIGRIGGQGLSDRFDDRLVIVVASLMASVGAIIASIAPTPLVAYIGFAVLGLGVSVVGPLGLAMTGRSVRAKHRTSAIAKAAVMGFSGFFIAPVLMGGLSELFGLRMAYASVAIVALMSLPLLWALSRR